MYDTAAERPARAPTQAPTAPTSARPGETAEPGEPSNAPVRWPRYRRVTAELPGRRTLPAMASPRSITNSETTPVASQWEFAESGASVELQSQSMCFREEPTCCAGADDGWLGTAYFARAAPRLPACEAARFGASTPVTQRRRYAVRTSVTVDRTGLRASHRDRQLPSCSPASKRRRHAVLPQGLIPSCWLECRGGFRVRTGAATTGTTHLRFGRG